MHTATTEKQSNVGIRDRIGIYLMREHATKKSVAELLGISVNTLNSKLDGDSSFSLEQAIKIADMVGCTLDELRVPVLAQSN